MDNEDVKSDDGAEDDDPLAEGKDPTAALAAATPEAKEKLEKDGGGSDDKPAEGSKIDAEGGDEDPLAGLTDDQLTKLSSRPDIINRVLAGDITQDEVTKLVNAKVEAVEEGKRVEGVRKESAKTMDAAIEESRERIKDGTASTLDKLAVRNYDVKKQIDPLREGIIESERATLEAEMEAAIDEVAGDQKLTQEDLKALKESRTFATRREIYVAVMNLLIEKKTAAASEGLEGKAATAEEAARHAATAAKAKAGGTGVPAGRVGDAGPGNTDEDIGFLFRRGIGPLDDD